MTDRQYFEPWFRGVRLSPGAMLVLFAASGAGTWVAAPWAIAEIPPLAVACGRFALAAVLLLAWCRARGLVIDPRWRDVPIILGVAATSVIGYNILFLNGVGLAPASHGAVITPGFIPVITLLLTLFVLRERVAARQAVGAVLALGGLVLVIGPSFSVGSRQLLGDAMYVAAGAVWSVYSIIGRRAMRRFDASVITMFGAGVGAIIFLVLSIIFEPGGFAAYSLATVKGLAGVAYLGSIGTVVSFVFFYLGVQKLGAARASAYTVLIPLFGVALTVALLGEALNGPMILGAAAVLLGLSLTQAPAAQGEAPALEATADG